MRCIDIGSQPDTRIRQFEARVAHPARQPGRADPPARATSAVPGQAVCHGAAAATPTQAGGRGSPGTSVTLRPGKRLAELLEERGRDVERLGKRAVPQLDRVSEQHHLVSRLEPVDQPRADLRPAEQVRRGARAQVKVRDDGRQHASQYGFTVEFRPETAAYRPLTPSARQARSVRDTRHRPPSGGVSRQRRLARARAAGRALHAAGRGPRTQARAPWRRARRPRPSGINRIAERDRAL